MRKILDTLPHPPKGFTHLSFCRGRYKNLSPSFLLKRREKISFFLPEKEGENFKYLSRLDMY